MPNREYRFRFYLNARHKVNIANVESNIHPHTWELVLYIKKTAEGFIHFAKIEGEIKEYLSRYEGKYLNEVEPFTKKEPYMENIGEVINEQIVSMLCGNGWQLIQLDISENPSRTYIIKNETEICTENVNNEALFPRVLESANNNVITPRNKKSEDDKGKKEAINRVLSSTRKIIAISDRIKDYDEVIDYAKKLENTASRILLELDGNLIKLEANAVPPANEETEVIGNVKKYVSEHTIEEIELGNDPHPAIDLNEAHERSACMNEEITPVGCAESIVKRDASKLKYMLLSTGILSFAAVSAVMYLMSTGLYPWGSDSWYHLFKGHLLYNELLAGNIFPLYNDLWYNGIEPLRYWAPLPHYVLAAFELITGGNTALAYNIYIGFVFLLGAFGWILWGNRTGKTKLALALAFLWFFLPDNLRVMFSEGNLSRVFVSAIFPYLMLYVWSYFERPSWKALTGVFAFMLVIIFCHAMIAAMVGITVFLFSMIYGLVNRSVKQAFQIVLVAILAVMSAGIWLYPALKGGLVSMDQESVMELMRSLTYNISESLNPIHKLNSPDSYYFGIFIFAIVILGVLLGGKKGFPGFLTALLIFSGTTKAFLSVIEKLPMSQLFWMMRFTPLALGLFFVGLILWKNARKLVLIIAVLFILLDCTIAFKGLFHNADMPSELKTDLDRTIEMTFQRTAVFDMSEFGSFPSYYLSYNPQGKSVKQVFGSGWQGARTSQNIMWLNTALERGWYSYMLDRCLELGADTVLIKKDKIKDIDEFYSSAMKTGYEKVHESPLCILLKLDIDGGFATKPLYKGLGIGKYASNISFMFPEIETGASEYIDDYSTEKLEEYDVIYLSGFKYRDRLKAEEEVKKLSEKGTRFIIDLTNAQADAYTSKPGFLGVIAEPIEFAKVYPELRVKGKSMGVRNEIPVEYDKWNTIYLENLDKVYGSAEFKKQEIDFLGTKYNDNIYFVGFNLPFFALETKDKEVIRMIQDIAGSRFNGIPERKLVNLQVTGKGNSIELIAGEEGVVTGIADVEAFRSVSGKKATLHNLIMIEGRKLILITKYPYAVEASILSAIGILCFLVLIYVLFHRKNRLHIVNYLRQVKRSVL